MRGTGFGGKRPSHGAQLPGKMRPLAARSLQGEELIVVRTRDVWKIDLGTATGTSHDLYSREPYKMATFYAKFTETESAPLLEVASRLWNKPPRYTIWNVDTVAPEEAKIKPTIVHLEIPYNKSSLGHWVLRQQLCGRACVLRSRGILLKAQSSVGCDRLALVTESGTLLVMDFRPMILPFTAVIRPSTAVFVRLNTAVNPYCVRPLKFTFGPSTVRYGTRTCTAVNPVLYGYGAQP